MTGRDDTSRRYMQGLVLGVLLGVLIGFVGGFVAGRVGRNTTTVLNGGSAESGTTVPPSRTSSRTDPVPVGTPVDIGNGWRVTSKGIVEDAKVSSSYKLPAERVWVTFRVAATYVDGEKDSESPFFGLDLTAVGQSGTEYTETDAVCIAQDPTFSQLDDVFKGGTEEGNICLAVKPDDVDSLLLVAQASLNTDGPKTYLALNP